MKNRREIVGVKRREAEKQEGAAVLDAANNREAVTEDSSWKAA